MARNSFKIYLVTNTVNSKVYVGKTSKTMSERWKSHQWEANSCSTNMLLHAAIRKYGTTGFTIVLLAEATTLRKANSEESKFIAQYNSQDPKVGYNMTKGGDGRWGMKHSPATKKRIAASRQGKKHSLATRKRISKSLRERRGHSAVTKAKIGAKAKERFANGFVNGMTGVPSPMKGKKHTLEAIEKISEAKREYWALQRRKKATSKRVFTAEHRSKLSDAKRGRSPWNKGIKMEKPAWNKGISPSAETLRKLRAAASHRIIN